MSDRRNFLRKIGILGAFASGPAIAQNSFASVQKTEEIIPVKDLEKNVNSLKFIETYGEIDPSKNTGFFTNDDSRYKPETIKKVEVTLKVGPDGKLYVKENDIWRKI